jgi:hypothetical protein
MINGATPEEAIPISSIQSLILTVAAVLGAFSARAQPVLYWDANADFTDGIGGDGITTAWNANAARWFNGAGNVAWSDGAVAVFAGSSSGVANIFGSGFNPAAHSIIFSNASGYEITGPGQRRLIVTSGNIYTYVDADIGVNITNAPADLTTGLKKRGPAKLSFIGANNSFQGGLFVLEGTLAMSDKNTIGGQDTPLTVNGARLELTGSGLPANVSSRVLYVGDNGATFDLPTTDDHWLFQQLRSTNGAITKTGAGTLGFGNINGGGDTNVSSGVGPIILNEGTLAAQTSYGSVIGIGPVTVNANGTLAGAGLIGGSVTVTGTVSPTAGGATTNALPNMTLQNGLNLSGGGTYQGDLLALKDDTDGVAGKDFDRISITHGDLTLGGSSKLSINFGETASAPDAANSFWQANHTWTVIELGDAGSHSPASNFGSLQNASYAAGTFTTSLSGNGSVLLTFTPSVAAAPHIESIVNHGRTNVVLTWTSVSNGNYNVEYNADLSVTNWTVLRNITAAGSITSVADPSGGDPHRFYRVVLLGP